MLSSVGLRFKKKLKLNEYDDLLNKEFIRITVSGGMTALVGMLIKVVEVFDTTASAIII